MATAVTLEVLPAGRGDALWIECHRTGKRPWRAILDGGLTGTGDLIADRFAALAPDDRHVDLVVVSHLDSDHIGGLLRLFSREDLGITYGDVWFNGLAHLPEGPSATRSVTEAESMVALLTEDAGQTLPWNRAFGGGPVTTGEHGSFVAVSQPDWPSITLVGPTDKGLRQLRKKWLSALTKVKRGETDGDAFEQPPASLLDIDALASTKIKNDSSRPNRSSIAFLLEHQGVRLLLTGDTYRPVLGAAITNLCNERGITSLPVDVFKLPHHGSRNNVCEPILGLAPAANYVVCTDGSVFGHPDDEALARVIRTSPADSRLVFNYHNARNERWASDELRSRFSYDVLMPPASDPESGVTLTFEARTT